MRSVQFFDNLFWEAFMANFEQVDLGFDRREVECPNCSNTQAVFPKRDGIDRCYFCSTNLTKHFDFEEEVENEN